MSDTNASKRRLLGHDSRIRYAVVCGSIAIAIFGFWSLSSTAVQSTNYQVNSSPLADGEPKISAEPANLALPVNTPRTGVPMLVAYPLAMLPDPYIEVNEGDYPWIARTIQYGETTITGQEMKEYFGLYSIQKSHYFAINSADGSKKYFSIEFREPPISLQQYNVKAFKLDIPPEKFITVTLKDQPWLQPLVEESHTWQPVDNIAAKALKQLSDVGQTFNFKVVYDDGHEEYYNLRYAGPALSTVS